MTTREICPDHGHEETWGCEVCFSLLKKRVEDAEALNKRAEDAEERANNAEERANNAEERANNAEDTLKERSLYAMLKLQPGSLQMERKGTESSYVKTKHLEAQSNKASFTLHDIPENEDFKKTASMLMTELSRGQKLFFSNEADVSGYIAYVIKDAVALLQDDFPDLSFYVRREHSIFRARPDHTVVYEMTSNLPVLSIEDKQPLKDTDIFTETVVGQALDYARLMKGFGHKAPFVIVTSFQETRVFWLDEPFSNELASGKERSVSSNVAGNRQVGNDPAQNSTPSPNKICPVEEFHEGAPASDENLGFKEDAFRKLKCSDTYEDWQLVRVVFSALICGIKGLDKNRASGIRNLSTGTLLNQTALKLTENGYSWGFLSAKVGQHIWPEKKRRLRRVRAIVRDPAAYYVVGVIGAGDTSKVFHALDSNGEECAIKMYVERTPEEENDPKLFEEKANEKTRREVKRAEEIYKGVGVKYKYAMLNKHHCVIMPFFAPVPKEDRNGALEHIQDTFEKKFCHAGYRFRKEDRRWRHVGTLSKGGDGGKPTYILFDLADLEKGGTNSDVETYIQELRERSGTEPDVAALDFCERDAGE